MNAWSGRLSLSKAVIVLADGCFDPLHLGHIRYLRVAASLGTVIVNVAPDEAVRAKGREPFQTCYERCETVRSLKYVADVRAGALVEAIRQVRPQFLLKGRQWSGGLPSDVLDACAECGATILYTETQAKTSTERLNGATTYEWAGYTCGWGRDGKWFIDRH
jgi:cytidyltransferase-like protein